MLTINALVAATSVLIPVQAHYLSAKGLEILISSISRIKPHINHELDFKGILITMHNERLNFTKSILNNLEQATSKSSITESRSRFGLWIIPPPTRASICMIPPV